MINIQWNKLPQVALCYVSYQFLTKNPNPSKWFAIVPLYGLWGVEKGRSPEEMFGYIQFMNEVARQIYLRSIQYRSLPIKIYICGGKTRTEVPEFSELSEADTCFKPFFKILEQNGVDIDLEVLYAIEDSTTSKENISIAFEDIENRQNYNPNTDHIMIFSDEYRGFKLKVLASMILYSSYEVVSVSRFDIHPSSNKFIQFFATLNQI